MAEATRLDASARIGGGCMKTKRNRTSAYVIVFREPLLQHGLNGGFPKFRRAS